MTSLDTANQVFLGCGGLWPGVVVLRADEGRSEWLAELHRGESVYALDVNLEGEVLAFGTRRGRVYVRQWSKEPSDQIGSRAWLQGAPVLSVCWISDSLLCSSDSSGRCLLWRVTDPDHPMALETNRRVICALARGPRGELVGLAQDGCLLFWSSFEGTLLRCIRGLRPTPKLGLISLKYWACQELLLYPGEGGWLCACRAAEMKCQYVKAHQEGFYVILPVGEQLLTVGKEDRAVKVWRSIDTGPACEIEVPWPHGFITGWPMDPDGRAVLLIDEEGTAGVFNLSESSVKLAHQLDGSSYRVAVGLPPGVLARRRQARDEAKARELMSQAGELIGRGRAESLDGLATELESLGFAKAALGIRAQQARLQNAPLEELQIRRRLAHNLNNDHTACRDSMIRYAALSEQLWCLREAWSIYHELDVKDCDPGRYEWLEQTAKLMDREPYVIEPDLPLTDAVRAATVLGNCFSGIWVVACSHTLTLPSETLCIEDFIARYEQIRHEGGQSPGPAVTCRRASWIRRDAIRQTAIIDFGTSSFGPDVCIESVLRFDRSGSASTITPVLLLNADRTHHTTSTAIHNQDIISVLEALTRDGFTSAQQWDLQRLVSLTVRRLWTESAWRRNEGKGTKYGHTLH